MQDFDFVRSTILSGLKDKKRIEADIQQLEEKLNQLKLQHENVLNILNYLKLTHPDLYNTVGDNEINQVQGDVAINETLPKTNYYISWPDKITGILRSNSSPMYVKDIVDIIFEKNLHGDLSKINVQRRVANALAYMQNKMEIAKEKRGSKFVYRLLK